MSPRVSRKRRCGNFAQAAADRAGSLVVEPDHPDKCGVVSSFHRLSAAFDRLVTATEAAEQAQGNSLLRLAFVVKRRNVCRRIG